MQRKFAPLTCLLLVASAGLAQQAAQIGPGVGQFVPTGTSCSNGGAILISTPPDQVSGLFSDVDCQPCGTGQQSIAHEFTLPAGGNVSELIVLGGYHSANTPPGGETFRVLIHNDGGATPGSNVSDEAGITPDSITQTGTILFGVNELELVLTINPIMLAAGTYWLEIFNETADPDDDWFWETGSPQDPNTGLSTFATETPGITWNDEPHDFAITICDGPVPVELSGFDVE